MKKVKTPLLMMALVFGSLLFTRCTLTEDLNKLQSAMDSVQLIVGTPEFNTAVHLEFVDAKTGEPISYRDISVTVSGQDAAYVYDNIGSRQETYSSTWGMLDLVIDPHRVDTNAIEIMPIQFDITANLSGYLSSIQNINIFDASRNTVVVPMINLNDSPEGFTPIDNVLLGSTDSEGKVNVSVSKRISQLNRSKSDLPTNAYTVSITKGSVLKDSNGDKLTGDIYLTSSYVDIRPYLRYSYPNSQQIYARYFFWPRVKTTLGFREVKFIANGSLVCRINVPSGAINDNTSSEFKDGDLVNIYHIGDQSYSTYVLEKTVSVKNHEGVLVFENSMSSNFSGNFGIDYPMCTNNWRNQAAIHFDARGVMNSRIEICDNMTYKKHYVNPQYIGIGNNNNKYNTAQLIFNPANDVVTHKFSVYELYPDPDIRYVFTPDSIDLSGCSRTAHDLTIREIVNPEVEFVKVNLTMSLKSKSNSKFVIRPSGTIYLNNHSLNQYKDYNINGGKTTFYVKKGTQYDVSATFGKSSGKGMLMVADDAPAYYKVAFTPKIVFNSSKQADPVTILSKKTTDKIIDLKYEAIVPDDVFNKMK